MIGCSTGQIADALGEDRDRVSYAIRKMGVKPLGRVGPVRVFPQSVMVRVKAFLAARPRKENCNARGID